MQGHLFDPDNPPEAYSKEEVDANLAQIKADMRNKQVERIRAHNEQRTAILFHDRREEG